MDVYSQIAEKIITQQENIIGPIAIEQASNISGLELDWGAHKVTLSGDQPKVIDILVSQYEKLFGRASVEASKEAAAAVLAQLPADKQPKSLQ